MIFKIVHGTTIYSELSRQVQVYQNKNQNNSIHLLPKDCFYGARSDMQPDIAFLTTCVKGSYQDDWFKLTKMISFLKEIQEELLALVADNIGIHLSLGCCFCCKSRH
jgi:hypothetical protein